MQAQAPEKGPKGAVPLKSGDEREQKKREREDSAKRLAALTGKTKPKAPPAPKKKRI